MLAIQNPLPVFHDTDGLPLDGGYLYFGAANQNPETAPVVVYWDAAGTQPVAQPARTVNGYIVRNGSAAAVYSGSTYSLTVRNAKRELVGYWKSSAEFDNAAIVDADVTLLKSDLASTDDAAKNAGMVGALYSLNYTARTIGAAVFDGAINLLWFLTEAQRAAVKAKTYADDHTATLAAALTYGNGRAIYMPTGGWKIGASTLNKAGLHLFGDGWGNTIIRSGDATVNMLSVTADNVTISDLEMHGAATAAVTNTFAVFTDAATPVRGLKVRGVKITGQAPTHGFANGIKFDASCDHGVVSECWIDRLWGAASGFGYCVLCGEAASLRIHDNWMFGEVGRGRHAVYLSGGANGCVVRDNYIEAFNSTCITQFSQGAQPPCTDNIIEGNRVVNGAVTTAPDSAGISIEGHSLRAKVRGNFVINSASCGIRVDGTTFTDLKDTEVCDNDVVGSKLIGVDIKAAVGGKLSGNFVRDSSTAADGISANVRFISDGATAASNWTCVGNRIPETAVSPRPRSAVETNETAPVPTGLRFDGNLVGPGTVSAYEFRGTTNYPVDGRLRATHTWNPPAIAAGASNFGPWTVNGALANDIVTVSHSSDTNGCALYGFVSAPNTVQVTVINASGGVKDIADGTLSIDVWKR